MLSPKQQIVLEFVKENPSCSSKEIHLGSGGSMSYATVKRQIGKLLTEGLITKNGNGRGTNYLIAPAQGLLYPTNTQVYFAQEQDARYSNTHFNFDLFQELSKVQLFNKEELGKLQELQVQFATNIKELDPHEQHHEMERLAIDLSWKSSQIEGNTYSLLETERLLVEKKTAVGKTKSEASMLLNHKEALDFILSDPDYVTPLTVSRIEDIHSLLIKDLGVGRNIRTRRVGISGTNYRPLDNEHQIREALEDMCELINSRTIVFEKALLLLLLISYIQAFGDGNKRTARIISNAILIQAKHCPLSFRTVDSIEYKKAMLLFYEQNNISAFKRIFIDQFEFAVGAYF